MDSLYEGMIIGMVLGSLGTLWLTILGALDGLTKETTGRTVIRMSPAYSYLQKG